METLTYEKDGVEVLLRLDVPVLRIRTKDNRYVYAIHDSRESLLVCREDDKCYQIVLLHLLGIVRVEFLRRREGACFERVDYFSATTDSLEARKYLSELEDIAEILLTRASLYVAESTHRS
jgi:hypothetical protein